MNMKLSGEQLNALLSKESLKAVILEGDPFILQSIFDRLITEEIDEKIKNQNAAGKNLWDCFLECVPTNIQNKIVAEYNETVKRIRYEIIARSLSLSSGYYIK